MIELGKAEFIGKGEHKACYVHPEDKNICIKVPYSLPDVDIEKELKYRSILKKQGKEPSLLTKYLGTVETDQGTGYQFELVRDFDGAVSKDMLYLLAHPLELQTVYGVDSLELLRRFRKVWLGEAVVTSDVDFGNYYVQRISADNFVVRIIDNIGTPAHLPLVYYFHFLAVRRAKRRWRRLIDAVISCEFGTREQVKDLY